MLVVVLAVLSWQMIHNVWVALHRQFEPLGDPGLMAIQVPGPGLDGKAASPGRPPSQLGASRGEEQVWSGAPGEGSAAAEGLR